MRRSDCHAHGGSERPRTASPASPGTALSRRCQNRCACARYMHAGMNKTHAASSLTLNESVRTPKSMYGARHAMLYARAMPCGGERIPERRCRKTPDFGLVEGRKCLFQTCRNIQLQRARAHAAPCPYQARPSHFYEMARGLPVASEGDWGNVPQIGCTKVERMP